MRRGDDWEDWEDGETEGRRRRDWDEGMTWTDCPEIALQKLKSKSGMGATVN